MSKKGEIRREKMEEKEVGKKEKLERIKKL